MPTTVLTSPDFLARYTGGSVFHPSFADASGRLVGNHGDALIRMGTQRIYDSLNIRMVSAPREADIIVMGGNGGMLERFKVVPAVFAHYCQCYADIPLAMMPATFYYPTRPLGELISEHRARTTLFCRERWSYQHLTRHHQLPAQCSVEIDHDHAFALVGSSFIQALQHRPIRHVLVVEREDIEHPLKGFRVSHTPRLSRLSRRVPSAVKRPLRSLAARYRSRRDTPVRSVVTELLRAHHGDLMSLPVLARDSSSPKIVDFSTFCNDVAMAAVIFTTRLHVAILGHLLGKRCYLFEGPYHKIRSIYDYSLAEDPNITLVARGELRPSAAAR